jgi:hypothetical protein
MKFICKGTYYFKILRILKGKILLYVCERDFRIVIVQLSFPLSELTVVWISKMEKISSTDFQFLRNDK